MSNECGAMHCIQPVRTYSRGVPVCHLHSNHFDPPMPRDTSGDNVGVEAKLDTVIELLKTLIGEVVAQ